jgi:hypothetical protein
VLRSVVEIKKNLNLNCPLNMQEATAVVAFGQVIPILPGSPLQLAIADGEAAVCDVLHR